MSQQAPEQTRSSIARFLTSPVLALVFAMFCWGSTTIFVRYIRHEAPPMGLAFWRNVAAGLILAPFAIGPLRKQWEVVRQNIGILAMQSLLLWVGGNALLFLSLQYTIAINAGVINSVEPIFIIVLARLIFGDRFSGMQAVGVAISLCGVLFLMSDGSFSRLLHLQLNIGDLIVTVAYMFWALYAVFVRKMPRNLDPRALVFMLMVLGAFFLLPLYLAEANYSRKFQFTPMTVATIVTLATFSSAIAMILWNRGLIQLGATRAALFLHLIPVFTVILAIVFLGELLGMHHLVGIAFVASGIFITDRYARNR